MKYLFLSLMLLCLASCDDGKMEQTTSVGSVYGGMNIVENDYKGHHYLVFIAKTNYNINGVVHDPECPCNKKNNENRR